MRYFIRLGYRGEKFHGWQIQPHDCSVQQSIEEAMATLLRVPTPVTGAGRTDAGVNARLMVAHFDTTQPIKDIDRLMHGLNALLPPDIAIYSIVPVHDDAHARFDATSRTYKYFAVTRKDPFRYPLSWKCAPDLDFDLMSPLDLRGRPVGVYHHRRPLPAQHGACHRWHSRRGGPPQDNDRTIL